jgi:hypothetical protein
MLKLDENTVENGVDTQVVNYSLGQLRMAITGKS